ncbi:hypothetical protein [Streptomyces sp. NPDC002540]
MQVHDPGEILDDRRCHAAADVPRDDRFSEPDAQHGGGLHARIDADDQVQLLEGDERDPGDVGLGTGGREGPVALQVRGEVRHG